MSYAPIKTGYSRNSQQVSSSIVDYLIGGVEPYSSNNITIITGRVDYLIGNSSYYSGGGLSQTDAGFANLQWEQIEAFWETINEYWNV